MMWSGQDPGSRRHEPTGGTVRVLVIEDDQEMAEAVAGSRAPGNDSRVLRYVPIKERSSLHGGQGPKRGFSPLEGFLDPPHRFA
jgi:hypothetical protein